MHRNLRLFFIFVILVMAVVRTDTAAWAASGSGAEVTGSIVDTDGGLPIGGAALELSCSGQAPLTTKTTSDGSYRFTGVLPGVCSLLITAQGYQTTRAPGIVVAAAASRVEFKTAVTRTTNLAETRTIGRVVVAGASALQTTSTISAHVEPSVLQTQDYMRAGDALISVPGINTFTSSSLGDDLGVSIRGFDTTETATLLDGHPIGPIGAFGSGFDYQVSPFFGLRAVDAVFGSGATGVYGASTIAGAVDFQTLSPTLEPHGLIEQGVGTDGKTLTGLQATGTAGKFGYAVSHAIEGTYGNFPNQIITQNGLLGTDIRSATVRGVTYAVTSDYILRNDLAKVSYAFSPRTNFLFTGYSATSWDDKSGNGDNDFLTYQENLYNTVTGLQQNGGTSSVTLPNGNTATCNNFTQAVLNDSPQGFGCLSPQNYASLTAGPSGGNAGPWQAIHNQDYHARLSTGVGNGTVNLDTYVDNYGLDYNRAVADNSFHTDFYRTYGYLLDDEVEGTLHSYAFGYYQQHQLHTGDTYPFVDEFGNIIPTSAPEFGQSFILDENSAFVRDEYSPSSRFTIFGNLWLKHLSETHSNSLDPRVSLMYRPTTDDVVRLTTGHSNSEPDPSLLFGFPSFNTTPSNINPLCGGQLNAIGSVSNPTLQPETATDTELALGHRFAGQDNIQVDFYDTNEHNALFGGNLLLSSLGNTNVPPGLIAAYLARIQAQCHDNPTVADLSVGTTYNAASARYRGIELSGNFQVLRHLSVNAEYATQSAAYLGVPDTILQQNINIINGSQIYGIPLHKANLGFEYTAPGGFDVNIDGHYIGDGNQYNRPAFSFANGSLSQRVGHSTMTLGVNNIFNSVAQIYGYIGLGVFKPENQFGTDSNAFQQSSEQFGLSPRQYFFTVTYHV